MAFNYDERDANFFTFTLVREVEFQEFGIFSFLSG